MREFNLDLLINKKVAVNCKTKAEEEEFLQYLDVKNINWYGGTSIFENDNYTYNDYKSNTCFTLENKGRLQYSPIEYYQRQNYKILTLDDLIKPKNNFKEFGFEANFEGYIYEFLKPYYVGYVVDRHDARKLLRIWNEDGLCLNPLTTNVVRFKDFHEVNFRLIPINLPWYKNEDNFENYTGKLIINKYGNVRKIQSIDNLKVSTAEQNMYHDILKSEEWRLLTKEEIENLIY